MKNKRTLILAGVIYAALSVCLYLPYLKHFKVLQYALLLNSALGALGCFVLSRRWVGVFAASLFSGAVYGFCPFALGFAAYHPLAGTVMAVLPWLFCPAVFYPRTRYRKIITTALSLLPFIAIAFFFWLCSRPDLGPLFALPKNEKLQLTNMIGLIGPLNSKPHHFIFSFYHVPVSVLLMGLFMYVANARISVMIITAAALCLAFYDPLFQVSPIVWALVPLLFCSVLIGLGTQALAWAGRADRKYILICALVSAALAIATFAMGYNYAGQMHALTAVLTAAIFFLTKAQLRWHPFRWILLSTALTIDITLGAVKIIDKIL